MPAMDTLHTYGIHIYRMKYAQVFYDKALNIFNPIFTQNKGVLFHWHLSFCMIAPFPVKWRWRILVKPGSV